MEPIDPRGTPDDLDDDLNDLMDDEVDFEDDDPEEDIQSFARVPGVPGSRQGDLRAVRHEVR